MTRTRVKVCGVTRPRDAELAVSLGADLIGLNFWPGSPRVVSLERAREIAAAVAGEATLVGVFVNQSRREIGELERRVPLDLVQFHGDEGPDELAAFGERAIKVFRPTADFSPTLLDGYSEVWGFLFDRAHPTLRGGSGQAWPYERIGGLDCGRPVLVAGGLRPENVARAIRSSGAWGVDVCSGVETSPGVKSPEAMSRFFAEVCNVEKAG